MAIFFDMQRCFDTIDHDILFETLRKYGFDTNTLNGFCCTSSIRRQYIAVQGTRSKEAIIKIGVSHSYILGPLLALLYPNGLQICSNLHKIRFADDTTLFSSNPCLRKLQNNVNEGVKRLWNGLQAINLVSILF